jgi:hypothetical protein
MPFDAQAESLQSLGTSTAAQYKLLYMCAIRKRAASPYKTISIFNMTHAAQVQRDVPWQYLQGLVLCKMWEATPQQPCSSGQPWLGKHNILAVASPESMAYVASC